MTKLDFYLTYDNKARRHSLYLSVGAGAIVGGLTEAMGASFRDAVIACVVTTIAVEVARIIRYSLPERNQQKSISPIPSKRYLIQAGVTVAVVLIAMGARIPERAMAAFEQRLEHESGDPRNPSNGNNAKRVLETAHAASIKMSPIVIGKTGVKFIEASQLSGNAWGTTQQYLDYRSFLNKDFEPQLSQLTQWKDSTYRSSVNIQPTAIRPGETVRAFTVWFAGGYAAPDDSAKLESFDKPQVVSSGIGLFVIEGGAHPISLDRMYMKNVVVRSSVVAYNGGGTKLDHVYFVNCSFQFQRTPNALELAKDILTFTPVTFNASEPGILIPHLLPE